MAVQPKRRVRNVSLAFMGEEWKEAYAEFRYLTWEDSKRQREREAESSQDEYRAIDAMRETVMEAFVSGMVLNDKDELVEADAEAIGNLDIEAIGTLYQRVLGVPDPNA